MILNDEKVLIYTSGEARAPEIMGRAQQLMNLMNPKPFPETKLWVIRFIHGLPRGRLPHDNATLTDLFRFEEAKEEEGSYSADHFVSFVLVFSPTKLFPRGSEEGPFRQCQLAVARSEAEGRGSKI